MAGTHSSGKSTLIDAFLDARPQYEHLAEPFEFMDEAPDVPGAEFFYAQLEISRHQLAALDRSCDLIAERCPLDFLAYLIALEQLERPVASSTLTQQALDAFPIVGFDLIAITALDDAIPLPIPDWEDLELRQQVNGILLDLITDTDLVGDTRIVEVGGSTTMRLEQLLAAL